MRPTVTSTCSALSEIEEVHSDTLARSQRRQDGAKRGRGATRLADHTTHVVRMDAHLERAPRTATVGAVADLDVLRVVDDALDQVLESVLDFC